MVSIILPCQLISQLLQDIQKFFFPPGDDFPDSAASRRGDSGKIELVSVPRQHHGQTETVIPQYGIALVDTHSASNIAPAVFAAVLIAGGKAAVQNSVM